MARRWNTNEKTAGHPQRLPTLPPAPMEESEDDIVPREITPVTSSEDSIVTSRQSSERNRFCQSPFLQTLIDSSSTSQSTPTNLRKRCRTLPDHCRRSVSTSDESVASSPGHDRLPSGRKELKTNKTVKRKLNSNINTPIVKRYRPGELARLEIRKYRSSWNLLIPRHPFQRLVREITIYITGCPDLRYQAAALDALHESAEAFLIGLYEDSYLITLAAKRVTLMVRDIILARKIRGEN